MKQSRVVNRGIENPLKRLRRSRAWSLDQLSEASGVSRQLIIRAEQGCYPEPPPALLQFLLDNLDVEREAIILEYRAYQRETRLNNYGIFPVGFNVPVGMNPFTYLRNERSMADIYKRLCIHPATWHKVEKQPHLCREIPPQILEALSQSGYSLSWFGNLTNAWYAYKNHLNQKALIRG